MNHRLFPSLFELIILSSRHKSWRIRKLLRLNCLWFTFVLSVIKKTKSSREILSDVGNVVIV
uniref:Uncharacterized protein n=1 Tax=Tetranychus urticae TaxID=32264 RepID=T1JSI1_TETUR